MNPHPPFTDIQVLAAQAGTGTLVVLLLLAAWTDWRSLRIPNLLTATGMVLGIAFNVMTHARALDGLASAGIGLLAGIALFMPLWLLRVMGAGDVKLLGMVGAFLGALATLQAALVIGIAGGIAALCYALYHRAIGRLAGNTRDMVHSLAIPGMPLWRPELAGLSVGKLPYGISICAGTLAFLGLVRMGWL